MPSKKKSCRVLSSSLLKYGKQKIKRYPRTVFKKKSKETGKSKLYVSRNTNKLIGQLYELGSYETLQRDIQRTHIIKQLDEVAQNWIKDVAEIRGMCESKAQELCGKLYTYGSYRLGVHHSTTEMDTIIIVPKIIQRKDFYDLFYRLLSVQPGITECHLFNKDNFCSIRMKYNGFGVNMTMARLPYENITENFNPNDIELNLLDEYSLCSIHALQMTYAIIDLVPNFKIFSVTLRVIRVWAKICGVYSKHHGFFCGGTLTILVAYVCRMYPKAVPSQLVCKFFFYYANRDWKIPVTLRDLNLGVPMFDHRIDADCYPNPISVITPVYPQKNLTIDVNHHTQYLILDEFCAANETTQLIQNKVLPWIDFFHWSPGSWKHFITIKASASTLQAQKVWSELVDSNLKVFYKAWVACDKNTLCQYETVNTRITSENDLLYTSKWFMGLGFLNRTGHNFGYLPTVIGYFRRHLIKLAFKKKILDRSMAIIAYFEPQCDICLNYHYQGNLIYACDCEDISNAFALRSEEELFDDEHQTRRVLNLNEEHSGTNNPDEDDYTFY